MSSASRAVRALTFDVFGTLVDWYTSIAEEGKALGRKAGLSADWNQFALDWRAGYGPAMQTVNQGQAWQTIDVLHRRILDDLLARQQLTGLTEQEKTDFNLAWHRLHAWPDVREGLQRLRRGYVVAPLSNGNVSLLIDLARFNGLEWDCVLSSELARQYKPSSEVYATAARLLGLEPGQVMMVAAHPQDLEGARAVGFRTAYVSRPAEYGPVQQAARTETPVRDRGFDYRAVDLLDLSNQLGLP